MDTEINNARRRQRGRPQLTSREEILTAALDVLTRDGLAQFTMAKLAKQLGISVMALYFYFPSRDALLDAVSTEVFGRFDPPIIDLPWQEATRTWITQLYDLLVSYPVTLALVRRGEHISPTYIHIWLPMAKVLRDAGLSGSSLSLAVNWLIKMTIGLCSTRMRRSRRDDLYHMVEQSTLGPEDHALLVEIFMNSDAGQGEAAFQFGVEAIISALQDLIAKPR